MSGATAIRADLRDPEAVLKHGEVRRLLDFDQPVGLLLAAVAHLINDDAEAYDLVSRLMGGVPPGSYMMLSHAAAEDFQITDKVRDTDSIYRRRPRPGTSCATGPSWSGSSRG